MDKKPPEMPKTMRPIKKTNPFVVIQKKLREISINVPEYPEEDSIAAMRSRMGHLIALSQLHLVQSPNNFTQLTITLAIYLVAGRSDAFLQRFDGSNAEVDNQGVDCRDYLSPSCLLRRRKRR